MLDYLAAHEVAHLVEMNHSPRFWTLVQRIYPEMEKAKAWLDAHGIDLHRYGEQNVGAVAKPARLRASGAPSGFGALLGGLRATTRPSPRKRSARK